MTSSTFDTKAALLSAALATISTGSVCAAPPDVVESDGYFNTAMGTQVLPNVTAGSFPLGGNTGAGFAALYDTTSGGQNSALWVHSKTTNLAAITSPLEARRLLNPW
jgi:hypothetical protein